MYIVILLRYNKISLKQLSFLLLNEWGTESEYY